MDAALNQFYQHLGVERGLASLTLAAYARDLQDFWVFIEGRGRSDWGAVALADVQDYFAALAARGLGAPFGIVMVHRATRLAGADLVPIHISGTRRRLWGKIDSKEKVAQVFNLCNLFR